jgi:hypothetical protein
MIRSMLIDRGLRSFKIKRNKIPLSLRRDLTSFLFITRRLSRSSSRIKRLILTTKRSRPTDSRRLWSR